LCKDTRPITVVGPIITVVPTQMHLMIVTSLQSEVYLPLNFTGSLIVGAVQAMASNRRWNDQYSPGSLRLQRYPGVNEMRWL